MVTQLACATRKHEMVDKSGCPRTLGNGYPVMLGNLVVPIGNYPVFNKKKRKKKSLTYDFTVQLCS